MGVRKPVVLEFAHQGSPIDLYLDLVALHLVNQADPLRVELLPSGYRKLIEARAMIRSGAHSSALELLIRIENSNDAFIQAETRFLAGNIQYSANHFEAARQCFRVAHQKFSALNLKARELLAEFNSAQCSNWLGAFKEAAEIEDRVLALAQERGFLNLQALGLRAVAYRYLRWGNYPESLEYFLRAEKLFFGMGNRSDGALCLLYSILLKCVCDCDVDVSLDLFSERYGAINYRANSFKQVIELVIQGASRDSIQESALKCEIDIQYAISELLSRMQGKRVTERPTLKRRMGSQLLQFLAEKRGASAEECIEHLWPGEKNYSLLQKRLWTMIYRLNQTHRIIELGPDKKYRAI